MITFRKLGTIASEDYRGKSKLEKKLTDFFLVEYKRIKRRTENRRKTDIKARLGRTDDLQQNRIR